MKQKYQRPFYIIIGIAYLALFISVMGAVLLLGGCSEPEYAVFGNTDVVSYSNNFIQIESDSIVVLDNGMGRFDKWWIPVGTTFELIIHEVDDYVRFYDTQDFATFDDRIYTVGEGKDHATDFTALNPPVDYYYFSIEVVINGTSNTVNYVIDSVSAFW